MLLLGDHIETTLSKIGITSDRIHSWLGIPCNCQERKDKLNQLDLTIRQLVRNGVERTKKYLEEMLNE